MAVNGITDNAMKVLEKRYLGKDESGRVTEDVEGMFTRVARAVAAEEAQDHRPEDRGRVVEPGGGQGQWAWLEPAGRAGERPFGRCDVPEHDIHRPAADPPATGGTYPYCWVYCTARE